nr:MAG TPA: hypothetical protein [Caudoviricetes sp.]
MKSQRYQSKIRRGLGVLILRPLFFNFYLLRDSF